MTTYGRDAKSPDPPWPFIGREDELELVRRSLAVGRTGVVVTGPAGHGRTRLAAEAVRGADCARVAGTPETAGVPFAAFAHLLPEHVTLHRAVRLLSGLRLLWVDDAHLLDDASAAAVHQLAVQGRTRLLVTAADDAPVPRAISRLWTDELLPRLTLGPLPREDTAQLLAAGAGGPLEPLTARRLHRLGGGDLRLLRDLLGAVRDQGLFTRVPGSDAWAWRGPVPVTAAVRAHAAAVLCRGCPDERETLDRLAFAEPLPLAAGGLDLGVLEQLEADGLVHVDEDTAVRLADPLHGPVLRAAAGRLRTLRLTAARPPHAPALAAEQATLARRLAQADVRPLPAPVGEWLVAEGLPVPAGYAAVRARFARFRGALREAAAWAREGLYGTPDDADCRTELALAAAQSGDPRAAREALAAHRPTAPVTTWLSAAQGDTEAALAALDPTHSDPNGTAPALTTAHPAGRDANHPDTPAATRSGVREPYDAAHVDALVAVRLGAPAGCDAGHLDAPAATRSGARDPYDAVRLAAPVAVRPGVRESYDAARLGAPAGRDADHPETPAAARSGVRDPYGAAHLAAPAPAAARPGARDPYDAAHPDPQHAPPPDALAAYDAVRLGVPEKAAALISADLGQLSPLGRLLARHARALALADGPALDEAAEELERCGFLLFAAEAHAQAVRAHRDPRAARTARTRAVALARRCEGARTPALNGLVLGELTARQRQIVTLAAAGLSNREIAERLTLSVRTVGNHLYGAYTRLGAGDRGALPWLVELPASRSA